MHPIEWGQKCYQTRAPALPRRWQWSWQPGGGPTPLLRSTFICCFHRQSLQSLPSLKPTTKFYPEWQHLWGGVYRRHRSFGETICKRRFRFAQLTRSEVGMVISSREVCSQGCPIWWYRTRVPLIWQLPGMLSWTCRSYSAFSWGPQTLILQWPSKNVQHYLRLPHCVISSIYSLRHRRCSRPSLQELLPHALEVASRLVSGPHGSCPANATDIPARVVICSYGSWAPIPLGPCHISSSTRASLSHPCRQEEQFFCSEILTQKTLQFTACLHQGKREIITILCLSSQGHLVFASFFWDLCERDTARLKIGRTAWSRLLQELALIVNVDVTSFTGARTSAVAVNKA